MNQSIITCIFFSIAGYLSGSILYAYWIPKILFQKDICALSPDGNPGTANAFVYGGFRAGILALLLELFKGFFPVVLALRTLDIDTPYMIPILIAPVLGHAFPLQFHPKNSNKKGGKAIAVSFGVLLGIFPVVLPVLFLAAIERKPSVSLYSFFCGLNYPATSFPVHYYLWRILPSGLSLCAGSLH